MTLTGLVIGVLGAALGLASVAAKAILHRRDVRVMDARTQVWARHQSYREAIQEGVASCVHRADLPYPLGPADFNGGICARIDDAMRIDLEEELREVTGAKLSEGSDTSTYGLAEVPNHRTPEADQQRHGRFLALDIVSYALLATSVGIGLIAYFQ